MPQMNSRLRAKAYKLCKDRDGERCRDCKRVPVKEVRNPIREVKRLIVDHIDGNNDHNAPDGSNWRLLCQSCNIKLGKPKRARSRDKFSSFKHLKLSHARESEREKPIVRYAEMLKNEQAERLFIQFVQDTIAREKQVERDDLLDGGAHHHYKQTDTTISQQALRRYLNKLCNKINGDYEYKPLDDHYYVQKRGGDPA